MEALLFPTNASTATTDSQVSAYTLRRKYRTNTIEVDLYLQNRKKKTSLLKENRTCMEM